MAPPQMLAAVLVATALAILLVLTARGLLSARQAALFVLGAAVGAAAAVWWPETGHG